MGSAVNRAIEQLVPIIAAAPADAQTRGEWLERLMAAIKADRIPYIELLGDFWGELCVIKEIASAQADALLDLTRLALSPNRRPGAFFYGTSACLSALLRAERYGEIVEILSEVTFWPYKQWAVKALVAQGKRAEALRVAESCRGYGDLAIDRLCEEILLSSGMAEEAYERYGLSTNQGGTFLATFRAVAKRYPTKDAKTILTDLAATTPGAEGKWFAAAKSVGLYEEALDLASRSPCDPKTLTRAATEFAEKEPWFALGAGLLALRWLVEGYGYDVTNRDVWQAYTAAMDAATRLGNAPEIRDRIRQMVAAETFGERFVTKILGKELRLK